MCLILFAHRVHPDYPLVLAANRDEFFARPSLPAAPWTDQPSIVGGRDLEKGGSWLAVSTSRRLAAVTNYRDGARRKAGKRSRGWLITDFLQSNLGPEAFLHALQASAGEYDGYNLLVAADGELFHHSNVNGIVTAVTPGIHGLSNGLLDTPWPKVERGKRELERRLRAAPTGMLDGLLDLLADTDPPHESTLPQTGISPEWERVLATIFIGTPEYGTRSSTVVLQDRAGTISLTERNWAPGRVADATRSFQGIGLATPAAVG